MATAPDWVQREGAKALVRLREIFGPAGFVVRMGVHGEGNTFSLSLSRPNTPVLRLRWTVQPDTAGVRFAKTVMRRGGVAVAEPCAGRLASAIALEDIDANDIVVDFRAALQTN